MRTRRRNTVVTTYPSVKRWLWTEGPDTGYSYVGDRGTTVPHNSETEYDVTGYMYTGNGKEGVDEYIYDQPSGHGAYNDCLHTRYEWDFPSRSIHMEGESYRSGQHGRARTSGTVSAGYTRGEYGLISNDPIWDSSSNAALRARANAQFGIQDSGTNLPTFLGELRDFSHVFAAVGKHWRRAVKNSRDGKSYRHYVDRALTKRLSLKQFFDSLVSADLMYQFAIRPLISDIGNLMQTGKHLSSQLERLKSDRPQYVRGSVRDDGYTTYNNTTSSYEPGWKSNVSKTRNVTYWAKVKYNLDSLPSQPAILADALGFDDPHLTVLELTRWSFVWDYFIDVSGWLGQWRGNYVDTPYTLLDEGYSEKFESVATVTTYLDNKSYRPEYWNITGPLSREIRGSVKYLRYRRTKGALPLATMALPQVRLPDLRQVTNLVELVYLFNS